MRLTDWTDIGREISNDWEKTGRDKKRNGSENFTIYPFRDGAFSTCAVTFYRDIFSSRNEKESSVSEKKNVLRTILLLTYSVPFWRSFS